MTPEELRDVLIVAGVNCRVQRAEVVVEHCVFCGNPRFNLELSAHKGVYHCWACNAGGRVTNFLERFTGQHYDIPVHLDASKRRRAVAADTPFTSRPLLEVPSACHYFETRGFDPKVMSNYGLVVCAEEKHLLSYRIAIPGYDYWTGARLGWFGRTYINQQPKYMATFNELSGLRQQRGTPCVLVEGALDGIAVHLAGYQVMVLGGLAAPLVIDHVARLREPLCIMFDGEAHSRALQVYWQLLPVHADIHVAELTPGQDPASLGSSLIKTFVEATR